MKNADIGVALYLLAAVIFFIVPISSTLLDVMIAINISIALIILFNTLFVKEVLDMSFFPTLLLFTTIFRISLNVSSTRLILSTGAPGNVVTTFGQFVGGGDLVIGAIIFIVLIIIQFVVINKGSERVAEVTARFTLDAMPGKQMAIDADLNTGAITEKEARERRNKIQEESAFFGSMDGATKYVKGDATAGLIITFINLIGGTVMGVMSQGLSFAEAIQQYGIRSRSMFPDPFGSDFSVNRYSGNESFQGSRFWNCSGKPAFWHSEGALSGWCNACIFGDHDTFDMVSLCRAWSCVHHFRTYDG